MSGQFQASTALSTRKESPRPTG